MLKRRQLCGAMGAMLAGVAFVAAPAEAQQQAPHWVASWASAQQIPEPHNALPPEKLNGATLRQVIRTSIGGAVVRVQISNAFGTEPLALDGAHLARSTGPAGANIVAESDHALTFDGKPGVVVPAGASYWSDPVKMAVEPLSNLAISLYFAKAPAAQTGHPGSRTTSYILPGAHLSDGDLPNAETVDHWYQIAGLAVSASPDARAIVTLGDSITDGRGTTTNGNDRWTDRLAERLQADPTTRDVSVLNMGIGGNRILNDGLGPNALARFDRDVLAQPGIRYLIVLEGINDLGSLTLDKPVSAEEHRTLTDRMIGALKQMVARAHMHGIKAIGATIMPDGGSGYYHPDAMNEADRRRVNEWIRSPGNFDAVIDFAKLTADPSDPTRLASEYDSGDGLHPGPQGYRAMADSIPLSLFRDGQ